MRVWLLGVPVAIAACAHEEHKAPSVPEPAIEKAAGPSPGSTQYLVADPSAAHAASVVIPLGARGLHGLIVDKRRIVVGQGEPRVAVDAPDDAFLGGRRIPQRFGGGFLFWTASTLYRSDAFDGKLAPIARVPDAIDTVSFMPKAVLARTHNGERWGITLPKGERAHVGPLGIADVEALDDGRAVAFNDQGAVFTSTDHGEHWVDATAHVKSSPIKVANDDEYVWIIESNGGASRLEPDGHLSWFDKAPVEAPFEVRPRDPRWRGAEAPLRVAFRAGASLDESTAIVLDGGDVVRVDLRSGDVLSSVSGRLPPDAQCEAVPIAGDVLFACVSRAGGSSFVVSHTLGSEAPVVEQTLAAGGHFYASDDGGLAYEGACQGVATGSLPIVCVRTPGGRWEEHDVSGLVLDGGVGDVQVARWVPRADGQVVAIVAGPNFGIYDPATSAFTAIDDDVREAVGYVPSHHGVRHGKSGRLVPPVGARVVDTTWSFASGGTLRGAKARGSTFEITADGKVTHSPYGFETIFAGANGLGKSADGRLYQSTDHGATWAEVATPPSGSEGLELVSCTSAGCDLGAFYRIGWSYRPPRAGVQKTVVVDAPEVRRVRGLELSCKPQGPVVSKVLPRTGNSPDDLGLGASRLPIANARNDWSYVRNPVPRGIVNPVHEASLNDSESAPALRAFFSGFATTRDTSDVITVMGPNTNAMALRRALSFVAPFDPLGRVVRGSIAMSDVVAAARRAGMTTDEILAEDVTENGVIITMLSADPAAPSDLAVHNVDHGLIAVVRGERARVAIRASQNSANVVSGVITGADEAAFLEVDPSGVGHVFKVGSGAVTDLFDVSPTANDTLYPANPDALAVGPKGDLAVLRTPSGSDPASSFDPAYVLIQAMPPAALAPWSELKLADDPACKAEQGGYRAVLQLIAPWVRFTNPDLRADESPMIARVRWTAKRVCLEGFEVRVPPVSVRIPGEPSSFATWVVARGSTFARVGIAEGLEWRQALECSIVSAGP